jgi:hypothetical protein
MPITLPTPRQPQRATPRLLVQGQWQTGGADQFIDRLGTRWALDVQMPRLRPEPDGRNFAAALMAAAAAGDTVIWPWPQPGLPIGSPGSPLVNGAGQAGKTLVADGFATSYPWKRGQFFSILSGGRRFIYQIDADGAANGSGGGAIALTTRLRVSPADNAVLEFAAPMIEGRLAGDAAAWTLASYRVEPISFSIEELGQ